MLTECDKPPDSAMLVQFPNWIEDMTGSSRLVVAGCHVKPQQQAERIQAHTVFSAGDVWFADGTQCVALIKVAEAYALGIIVYDKVLWALERKMKEDYDVFRFRVMNQWRLRDLSAPHRQFDDPEVFPLRYCTRLTCTATRSSIHGEIGKDGLNAPWKPE